MTQTQTQAKAASTKVVTGKVRFSYEHVFKPQAASEGAEPKYSVCLLIPKTDRQTVDEIEAAIAAAKRAGASQWGGKIPAGLKLPLRDGDEERPERPEYRGMYFINASSKQKPNVVNSVNQPILEPTEFYSGCYGRVSINFYPFNMAGNRGVGAGLNNVQKLSDGESLTGRATAEEDFGDCRDEDDDDPLA